MNIMRLNVKNSYISSTRTIYNSKFELKAVVQISLPKFKLSRRTANSKHASFESVKTISFDKREGITDKK